MVVEDGGDNFLIYGAISRPRKAPWLGCLLAEKGWVGHFALNYTGNPIRRPPLRMHEYGFGNRSANPARGHIANRIRQLIMRPNVSLYGKFTSEIL